MRKVYSAQSRIAGLPGAIGIAAGFTALLFCIIPFSHVVNKPGRNIQLVTATAVDLPAPTPDETPPPPPTEEIPETAPEPQLADAPQEQIPLSADLEVALGSGGALAGYGEIRALAAPETIQQEAFDVTELEKRPEPVAQVAPVYPPELRKARIDGMVTLVFVLDEEGRVEQPRVENSTRPEFERPALDAVRKWRFRPGMKDGQPVRTYIRLPMRFHVASG